jgi:hypothetical protein
MFWKFIGELTGLIFLMKQQAIPGHSGSGTLNRLAAMFPIWLHRPFAGSLRAERHGCLG